MQGFGGYGAELEDHVLGNDFPADGIPKDIVKKNG